MSELKRVMHVEDDESIRMITSVTLESVGNLEVLSCESGFQAMEKFADFQPQALVLDVMMPALDGPGTLEELKKRYNLDCVMVLFMTAKVQEQELAHLREVGGFDIIEKPFDPMSLTEKIQSCWQRFIRQDPG